MAYKYTSKGNLVAVVTDGSAVLGLGNVGPYAALPVMEGKCVLFKELANIDAFPICLSTQDAGEIVETVKRISPVFGAINLEDIAAPKCFDVETRLKKELDIPVMHDDQHATAVVVLAALINAMKVAVKNKETAKVVINGAGAAGTAIAKMLLGYGIKNIVVVDSAGAIFKGRKENMNSAKKELTGITNRERTAGKLADVVEGADVFIGVSAPKTLSSEMVASMNKPIIFAMANPEPEIMPADAKKAGAVIVATGRSDFPNQVNNALCFPGIFRGALDARAKEINEEMKLAAAHAIASSVKPSPERIVPDVLDKNVAKKVAAAVRSAAVKSGAC